MKGRPFTLSVLATLLCGCAALEPSIPLPDDLYHSANQRFSNQPMQQMVARYGVPDEQTTVEHLKLFLWHADTTRRYRGPDQVIKTTGSVGSLTEWPYARVPYQQSTSTPTYDTESYSCTMGAGVNEQGVVTGIRFMGKMGACAVFMP